jgi:hypothetical protein
MKILLIILGIVSFSPLVQQRSTPANEKELKRQRQQARAIALIEQVGSEAELWDDKKSAVEALANAADLLWDRNPSRASKWLTKAWDLVDRVTESEQNPFLKEFTRQSDKAELKSIVLRVAHNHDPKLADKFVQKNPSKRRIAAPSTIELPAANNCCGLRKRLSKPIRSLLSISHNAASRTGSRSRCKT